MDFTKIKPALTPRRMPKNGPASSEALNDFIEQTIHDVSAVMDILNSTIIPAFNGFGVTGTYVDVDPIVHGIDGANVLTDRQWTDSTNPYLFDNGRSRPKTIKETALQIVEDLNRLFAGLNEVKARLGTSSDDTESVTSQATLSELETKVNFLNSLVTQARNDIADFLTASEIATAINDETINPASFHIVDGDVEANAAINPTKISGVVLTDAATHVSLPATYDVRDSILRIKSWIEDITGETFASFTDNNFTPTGSFVQYSAHVAASGSGAVSVANPHGMDIGDLSDAGSLLSKPTIIADFEVLQGGTTSSGGYFFVPYAVTATKVAMTLADPGAVGLGCVIAYIRGGTPDVLYSGLYVGPTPTPGSDDADISFALEAGDMIFISGVDGDGANAKVHVFGRP